MLNIKSAKNRIAGFRSKAAFTLVEVMIGIMLTTIVLTSIFMIWSKVQSGIVRSHVRQTLQNEMRKIANFMQNDFKSIKYEEDTFKLSEGTNGNFTLSFEKFKEAEEDKLAQDSTEKVTYTLNNTMLVRNGEKTNILSVHCDGINISRATEDSLGSGDLESSDEDFKAGREAKLDITITGKMAIPGAKEDMYYVEKTSVVMRNEYYKNINKNYMSTFDLAKKNVDEVIKEGSTQEMAAGGELDAEYLKSLDKDVLEGMDESQKEMLEQAENSLKDINDAIDETDTGESGWTKFWDGCAFWSETDGEKIRGLRSELSDTDDIDEVKNIKSRLETYVKDKEEDFRSASIPNYGKLSPEQLEIYKKAYEMKVQDRTLQGGYEKLVENAESDEDKAAIEKPVLMIDTIKGQTDLTTQVVDKDGNTTTLTSSATTEENEAIIEAYNKINLDWMGEFGEERDDVGIYTAAKSLIQQADTKIDVLDMQKTCQENREKIAEALKGK